MINIPLHMGVLGEPGYIYGLHSSIRIFYVQGRITKKILKFLLKFEFMFYVRNRIILTNFFKKIVLIFGGSRKILC